MLTITCTTFNINLLCEKFYAYQLGKQSYFKVALIFFHSIQEGCFVLVGVVSLVTVCSSWDLSSLARDWTRATTVKAWHPKHYTTPEFSQEIIKWLHMITHDSQAALPSRTLHGTIIQVIYILHRMCQQSY